MRPPNAMLPTDEPLSDGRHRLIGQGRLAERDISSDATSSTVVAWNRDGGPVELRLCGLARRRDPGSTLTVDSEERP